MTVYAGSGSVWISTGTLQDKKWKKNHEDVLQPDVVKCHFKFKNWLWETLLLGELLIDHGRYIVILRKDSSTDSVGLRGAGGAHYQCDEEPLQGTTWSSRSSEVQPVVQKFWDSRSCTMAGAILGSKEPESTSPSPWPCKITHAPGVKCHWYWLVRQSPVGRIWFLWVRNITSTRLMVDNVTMWRSQTVCQRLWGLPGATPMTR